MENQMDSDINPVDDSSVVATEDTSDINSVPSLEVTDLSVPPPEAVNQPAVPQSPTLVQVSFGRAHAGLPMVQTIINN